MAVIATTTIKAGIVCDSCTDRMNGHDDFGATASANSLRNRETADTKGGGISFTAIVFFVLFLTLAAMLLIAAGVVWLADILDSAPLACLIAGGAAVLISAIVYFCSIRKTVAVLNDYLGTMYETARIARSGYERIKKWVSFIFE